MDHMVLLRNIKTGDPVDGRYAVRIKRAVQSYSKGFRFELIVGDPSGDVVLVYWGGDEVAVKLLFDAIKKYDVIEIKGIMGTFKDMPQISVNEGALRVCEPSEYDPKDFVKIGKRDIEDMFSQLRALIDSIKSPELRKVLDAFFLDDDLVKRFKVAPAAKQYHHNHLGGLLEHTLDVAQICDMVIKHHPEVDRDLTITGAILHDIGKVDEYKVSSAIDITTSGALVGHIHRTLEMFLERTKDLDFPEDLSVKLKHIFVSHHGTAEFGSPKKPVFPEALLIHKVDDLDAALELMITKKEEADTEDDHVYTKELGFIYLK